MKGICFNLKLILICTIMIVRAYPEKHITVIIPSYNNAACYAQNLSSVINQQYDNFDVIYIDDASTDGTGDLVAAFIQENSHRKKITLLRNAYNRKALANVYSAVHSCYDNDLVVILDGDDWFANDMVLSYINELYSTREIWFAYAQYKNVPEELAEQQHIPIMGYARPTPESMVNSRQYRLASSWYWSGLYTFYAGLFKKIALKHFIFPFNPYKGKFFPTSKDGAMVYAMLEMCGTRFAYIPDVLLHRNIDTPLNDFKINKQFQKECGNILRKIPPYEQLDSPDQEIRNATVEVIVLPEIRMLRDLFGLSRNKKRDSSINTRYVEGILITMENNIMKILKEVCKQSSAEYVYFAYQKEETFDIKLAIDLMNQTGATCLLSDTSIVKPDTPIDRQAIEHLKENIYAICTAYTPIEIYESMYGIFRKNRFLMYVEESESVKDLNSIIYNNIIAKNNLVLITTSNQ